MTRYRPPENSLETYTAFLLGLLTVVSQEHELGSSRYEAFSVGSDQLEEDGRGGHCLSLSSDLVLNDEPHDVTWGDGLAAVRSVSLAKDWIGPTVIALLLDGVINRGKWPTAKEMLAPCSLGFIAGYMNWIARQGAAIEIGDKQTVTDIYTLTALFFQELRDRSVQMERGSAVVPDLSYETGRKMLSAILEHVVEPHSCSESGAASAHRWMECKHQIPHGWYESWQ